MISPPYPPRALPPSGWAQRATVVALIVAALGNACDANEGLVGAQDAVSGASPGGSGSATDSGDSGSPTIGGRSTPSGGEGGQGWSGEPTMAGSSAAGDSSGGGDTVDSVVGALDGRLMQFPCANDDPFDDCDGLGYVVDGVVHSCFEGESDMVLDHPIAGPPGAHLLLTLRFYGIMEPKSYGPGVVREAAPGAPDRNGGEPTPWATAPAGSSAVINSHDSYELSVHDAAGLETARHYLNASPDEGHWTLLIDYEKTIEVEAGGFVRLRRHDNNCRLMKNCGATGMPECSSKARTVDVSAAQPPPPSGPFPSGLNQPGLNKTASNAGQWWMVDVTAVTLL
jgi:hypothetical protein